MFSESQPVSPVIILESFTTVIWIVSSACGTESASLEFHVLSPSFIGRNSMSVVIELEGIGLGYLSNFVRIGICDFNIRVSLLVVSGINP